MKLLSRTDLQRSLKQELKPLYLLLGPEVYLRNEAADAITDAALEGTLLREFNESSFNLLSTPVQTAIAAAEQLPMMANRLVVKITEFSRLREADEEILTSYLLNPAPSSVVILIADDLDKRKKVSKTMLDQCVVVDFSPIKDAEAKSWAKSHVGKLNVSIDEQALSEVVRLVGTNIQTLSQELEKLAAAAAQTSRITLRMVDELIGRSRELSNFELADHILERNRKRALQTLHRLLDDGAEPLMLIGLIGSNYRRLALGKDLLMRGAREEIFRSISMPPFKRDSFMSTLQRTDAAHIARGIQLIAAADLAIKTSQATPRLQVEMLVCELTG
jgi:DNA polymerase-3 subunit delta